jgi:hypothetical protein
VTLYAWELTALEWVGPRLNRRGGFRLQPKYDFTPGRVPREAFEGVWVEIFSDGDVYALVFDAPEGGKLIGKLCYDLAVLDEAYRGRGLLARVGGEVGVRHGLSEYGYLRRSAVGSLTPAGVNLQLRTHAYAIAKAVAQGIAVPERVRASVAAPRPRQRQAGKVPVSRALVERLRVASAQDYEMILWLARYEKLVEVVG